MLEFFILYMPPAYAFEIGVLLFPLLSIVLFHTPTYKLFMSVIDHIGEIIHDFSSMFTDLGHEWEKKVLPPQQRTDNVQPVQRKLKRHRKGNSGTTSKMVSGVEQETQVTFRDLEALEVRQEFPKLPFYYRCIDTAMPHVWASHLSDSGANLDSKKEYSTVEVQVHLPNNNDIALKQNSDKYTPHNFSTNIQKESCETQTIISGNIKAIQSKLKRAPSFEISCWTGEVESLSMTFCVAQTARRYLEQLIPCPEHKSFIHILGTKDYRLQLDRLSLRYIPTEIIDMQTKITHLDLSRNMLTSLPDWFFDSYKNILILDLSFNYLYEIPFNFRQLVKLRELNLSHNRLQHLPHEICMLPYLHSLDVSYNSISWIPDSIRQLKGYLTHLDISNNLLMGLPEDFAQLKRLKYLNYEGNILMYTTRADILKDLESAVPKKSITPTKEDTDSYKGPFSSMRSDDKRSSDFREDMSGQLSKGLTILELFENEQDFLKRLNLLQELYILPLSKHFSETAKHFDIQNISQKDMHRLFPPEYNDLIKFSRSLFIELKQLAGAYESDPFRLKKLPLGEIFLEKKQFFKEKYVSYIRLYEMSCKILRELCKESPSFARFIQSRETLIISEGLQLKSLLILPLYRLYYYSKITRSLLSQTSQEKEDTESLSSAMKLLSDCLLQQKQEILRFDNRYRILSIQKRLGVKLQKPGRVLVREGKLTLAPNQELGKLKNEMKQHMKEKKMSLNPYLDILLNKMKDKTAGDVVNDLRNIRLTDISVYVYLFNDIFIVREMNILNKIMNGSHLYELVDVSSVKSVGSGNEFILEFRNGTSMTFRCESKDECIEWIANIDAVQMQLGSQRRAVERMTENELEFSEDSVSLEDEIEFEASDGDSIVESEDSEY